MENIEMKEEITENITAKKAPKAKKSKKQLKITLIKSANGAKPNQVKTVEALGLTKLNSEIIQPDNEAIRGMIFTIKHLVKVEEQ